MKPKHRFRDGVSVPIAIHALPFALFGFWITFMMRSSNRVIPAKSAQTRAETHSPSKPFYIAHTSGFYLSARKPERAEKVSLLFRNLSQLVKPEAVVVAGDIADSSENWKQFEEIRAANPSLRVIVALGNGDAPQDRAVVAHFVDFGGVRVKVVVFNPYRGRVAFDPLGAYVEPSDAMFDALEEELQKGDADEVIVACHYRIDAIGGARRLEGMLAKSNVRYYLAGNQRNRKFGYRRVNEMLEAVSVGLWEPGNSVGIIANDNGQWTYSVCDLDEDYVYLLTFPPARDQFFERNAYVGGTFRVNLVVFETHPLTLAVSLDGIDLGKMKADVKEDNYTIYGLNISTCNGIHALRIDGDITIDREFVVGPDAPAGKDLGLPFMMGLKQEIVSWTAIHAVIAMYFIMPPVLDKFFANYLAEFDPNIFVNGCKWYDVVFNFVRLVFVGQIYSTWRFHLASRSIKIYLTLLYLSTVFLPVFFVKGSEICIIWLCGFVMHGQMTFDTHALRLSALLSLSLVVYLRYLAIRSQDIPYPRPLPFLILSVILFPVCSLKVIYESGGLFSLLTTPVLYIGTPLVLLSLRAIVTKSKQD